NFSAPSLHDALPIYAERRHRLAAVACVLRMAVDIFEAVKLAVARGHQFDDAFVAVGANAWRLVELLPAREVVPDIARQLLYETRSEEHTSELQSREK